MKKTKRKKKKSDDPFKMWGAWLGAIIFPILIIIFKIPFEAECSGFLWIESISIHPISCILLLVIFFGIIGFFVGWGIHSLIRRYSK